MSVLVTFPMLWRDTMTKEARDVSLLGLTASRGQSLCSSRWRAWYQQTGLELWQELSSWLWFISTRQRAGGNSVDFSNLKVHPHDIHPPTWPQLLILPRQSHHVWVKYSHMNLWGHSLSNHHSAHDSLFLAYNGSYIGRFVWKFKISTWILWFLL